MARSAFLDEHLELTRRFFLKAGAAGLAAMQFSPTVLAAEPGAAPCGVAHRAHGGVVSVSIP